MATTRTTRKKAKKDFVIASVYSINFGNFLNENVAQAFAFADDKAIQVMFTHEEMAKYNFVAKDKNDFCTQFAKTLAQFNDTVFSDEKLKAIFAHDVKYPTWHKHAEKIRAEKNSTKIVFAKVSNTAYSTPNELVFLFGFEYKKAVFTCREINDFNKQNNIENMDELFNPDSYTAFNVLLPQFDIPNIPFYKKIKMVLNGNTTIVSAYDLADKAQQESIDKAIREAKQKYGSANVNKWLSKQLNWKTTQKKSKATFTIMD